ncbi:winged helix-turn-helix transcriptional regulator [Rhizobium alvei]
MQDGTLMLPSSEREDGEGQDAIRRHIGSDNCRLAGSILSRIGDKWSVMVVLILASGPHRFGEIKRAVHGISQRMLTFTLRGLERDGLVTRTVFDSVPPKVVYALSPLGHSLREPVTALGKWAFSHQDEIEDARIRFDRGNG